VLTRFLTQIVEIELPANRSFLTRLGGAADPAMAPTTYAYTRHLLDTAGRHDVATGLAAVLPCQWSYGEIGVRLVDAPPADPYYAEWISMFGGGDYAVLVEQTTDLLDRYSNVDGRGPGGGVVHGLRPIDGVRARVLGHGYALDGSDGTA